MVTIRQTTESKYRRGYRAACQAILHQQDNITLIQSRNDQFRRGWQAACTDALRLLKTRTRTR